MCSHTEIKLIEYRQYQEKRLPTYTGAFAFLIGVIAAPLGGDAREAFPVIRGSMLPCVCCRGDKVSRSADSGGAAVSMLISADLFIRCCGLCGLETSAPPLGGTGRTRSRSFPSDSSLLLDTV
jgi:hypothetical protein